MFSLSGLETTPAKAKAGYPAIWYFTDQAGLQDSLGSVVLVRDIVPGVKHGNNSTVPFAKCSQLIEDRGEDYGEYGSFRDEIFYIPADHLWRAEQTISGLYETVIF